MCSANDAGIIRVVAAEWRGSSGMGSAHDADRHAGASQMMSFRIHLFDT